MSENYFVWLVLLKLFIVCLFTMLYVIGGRVHKQIRRFGGGISFSLGIIGLSLLTHKFHWAFLALPILYPLCLSFGYGADKTWLKVLKRTLYGLAFGLIGLGVGIFVGNWYLGITHLLVCLFASPFLGVFNPIRAVDEEALIALVITIHLPFMF
jgi:hypothetical protein